MFETKVSLKFHSATGVVTPFAPWSEERKDGRTVSDVAAEVATDDDVPGWVKLLITLALDVSCDILLDGMLLNGVGHNGDDLGLHLLAHVHIFYNRLGSRRGLGGRQCTGWSGHGSGSSCCRSVYDGYDGGKERSMRGQCEANVGKG
jgi:hypothetical protein